MNHLYNNNDDKLRSKLTEHEFDIIPGAWDDMANQLDQYDFQPKAGGWWWSFPIIGISLLVGTLSIASYWKKDAPVQAAEPFLTPIVAQKTTKTPIATEKTPTKKVEEKKAEQDLVSPFKTTNKKPVKKKTTVKRTVAKKQLPPVVVEKATVANKNTKEETNQVDANIKRTRTIIKRQYSTTPLKKMTKESPTVRTRKTPIVGSFGIGDQAAHQASRWKFSVHAGMNTKVYGQTQQLSLSPYGGVAVGYRAGAHHGIQLGLQYKNIGKLKQEEIKTAVNSRFAAVPVVSYGVDRIDMLEVPLVYQCYPHPRMNVHAGIKGAWLFNVETNSPEINALSNKEKGIRNFDLGVLVGAEFNITKHIAVGLQYSLGLINLTAPAEQANTEMYSTATTSTQADTENLYEAGEMLVPTAVKGENKAYQPMLKLPKKLHNTDLQVHLKYTF